MDKANKPPKKASISLSTDQKRIATYIFFALAVVVVIASVLWRFLVVTGNQVRFEQALNQLAVQQQSSVVSYLSGVKSRLDQYAVSHELYALLGLSPGESSSDALFSQFEKRVKQDLSHGHFIRLFRPKQAQQEKDAGNAIGFVELDMINRLERGEPVFPEASKSVGDDQWFIHWAIPVMDQPIGSRSQPALLGILYAVTSLDGLSDSLSAAGLQLAQVQVVQNIGFQRSLIFLTIGNGGGYGATTVDVPNSHWQLDVKPSSMFVKRNTSIPLWFVLASLSMLGLAVGLAYKLASKKNKEEAEGYQSLDLYAQKSVVDAQQDKADADSGNPIYLTDQQADLDSEAQSKPEHESLNEPLGEMIVTEGIDTEGFPQHIFRAYDIRGVVEQDLTPQVAELVGRAVASDALEQGETAMLVGHDARSHSPVLVEHLKNGILSTGCDVIDIGLVPTPLMNFGAIFSDKTSSGIVVTASHNPKEYNGFKIVINEKTLVEENIQSLYQRIIDNKLTYNNPGTVSEEDFSEDYIDTVLADIAINNTVRIVVDAGNGATSELAPRLLEDLGCDVIPLFCEFNGDFPNHDPDPTVASHLEPLIEKIKEEQADLGVAFDGDGDRLVIVTGAGKIIWPDRLLMLFARDVISRNPGCDVIFDIKSTRQLNQIITSYGGRPIIWKTGHSHIKAKMRETNAVLAGEFSGHIFFKERWFGFDDGLYATARLLEILSLRGQNLDEMFESIPEMYATPEIKVPVAEDQKFTIVKKLIENGEFESGEKTTIDGLRVDFAKGWGLIRASNTSPILTLRFEAETENGIGQLQKLFKRELKKIDGSLPLEF